MARLKGGEKVVRNEGGEVGRDQTVWGFEDQDTEVGFYSECTGKALFLFKWE